MQDVLSLQREYREVEKPLREALCSASYPSRQKLAKNIAIVFMLILGSLVVLYGAWSIHYYRVTAEAIEMIANEKKAERAEQTAFERQRDAMFKAISRLQSKSSDH